MDSACAAAAACLLGWAGPAAAGEALFAATLVYRSLPGVSRAGGADWRVGLSLAHKSNGGTIGSNPGTEMLLVAMHRQY